jgi:glycosyltransferase involved in cell wall biosynthesis
MQPSRPLLTIAIPTYNRGAFLTKLLSALEGQISVHPEVEVIVSDNASADGTSATVRDFIARGMPIRYYCHSTNVGPDANFIDCLKLAEGKYFWLCGDDDIILPETLDRVMEHLQQEEFDLIYVTSYGFKNDYLAERQSDPLGRRFHRITSERHFTKAVNIMFSFISGIIVNKDRLNDIPHEDPTVFVGSHLIQLSWILPLLRSHRRSLILWERLVAAQQGNAGGYAIGEIFGKSLVNVTARCLPDRPDLAAVIINITVRRWLPSILYDLRREGNQDLGLESARLTLRRAFKANFRFWLFAYPVLVLPLPLAGLWSKIAAAVSKLIYMFLMPNFWRKEI